MRKCPRCDSENTEILTKSPVGDVWEMYICQDCFFSWRSTENVVVHDKFKLTPEHIANMQVIPPVPPLDQE